jgi:hypothetical protein
MRYKVRPVSYELEKVKINDQESTKVKKHEKGHEKFRAFLISCFPD